MWIVSAVFAVLRRLTKQVGPYVLLELLLPGGTLIALLLFLYRNGGLHPEGVLPVTRANVPTISAPFRVEAQGRMYA
jgi:hypothetical protein